MGNAGIVAELTGQMTVRSQADAIALEQAVRRHVWAWLDTLDVFDRPSLAHPQVRAAEQRARDAEWICDWAGVEAGWTGWLAAIRMVTP